MSIASRINEMTEHLKNDWDSIYKLGLDITEENSNDNLDKNIENIAPVLDRFYNQASDKIDLSENGIVGRTSQNPTIPVEYTRVDYIESSGTQYIDTGHCPSSNNDELEIQASYVGGNTVACLFGTFENNFYYYQLNKTTTANQFRLITYRGDVFYTFENYASKHTYLLKSNKLYIDDTEVATGSGTVDFESQTMYLFARNNSGTPNQFGSWRIYSCKIKTNDILVRDFVPCYRISDNVAGLYDTVNDVFYTNQGTGAFTYGNIIVEPSPDYPLEINNLSGDVEYKVRGKNKLPFPYTETSHTHNGITYTINDDGTVLVNGTATAQSNIKLYGNYQEADNKEPIGKYLYGGTNEVRIRALNHTGNSYTVLANDTGNGTEIDTSVYKKYYIEISVLNGVTVNNVLIKPMVLDSLDDLKYEPYISESFPLSLGDIELCNISDYKDRIYSQNGEFYLEKKTGKVTLDGSEDWVYSSSPSTPTPRTVAWITHTDFDYSKKYYSNRFVYNDATTSNRLVLDSRSRIYVSLDDTLTGITSSDTNAQKLEKIKTYISNNNIEVDYVLLTPITTEITNSNYPALYSALKEIQDYLVSYKINKEFLLDYSSPEIEY